MRRLLAPRDDPAWPPAVLDIEASGFGREGYPIEVGFVLPDGRGWCSLVRPEAGWTHWDPAAEAMHGISREALALHGRPAAEIALTLNDWLRGLVVYSDAWAHDYSWLNQVFEAAQRVPAFRLENLRALLNEDEASRWHALKQSVATEVQLARHRASGDARLLQLTLQRLRSRHKPRRRLLERLRA